MSSDTRVIGPDEPMGGGEYSAARSREIMDLVKKNRAVWASDLAKRASAKGIEWTPEEQARATSIMAKRGVTLLDDVNDESMFAIRTEGVGIEKPLLDRAMDQFASAATLGAVVPSGQYEGEGTLAGGVADVAGGLAGMAAPVGALTGVLSPALRAAAGPAAFGIYGGVTAGEGLDLAERGKAAAYNTALGAGLHIAPQALVAGVGKAMGPEAAAALAKAMGSIPGQAITAGGTMAGLEAASGGDPLAGGLGGILAAALTGGLVPGPTAPEARVAPAVEPTRPLAGLAAAEARVVPKVTPEVVPEAMPAEPIKAERKAPELKMVERPVEPQDAPVLLDTPVADPRITPEVRPNEIPEPSKTLLQRLEELKARNGTLAEEKRVADAARQQDIAAREEALASGALTPEQARAQRMAESAKRRTAPEDRSHVLPRERTSKGYTDNQLYEFSLSPDGMKVAMGSGLSFQDIMGARKRVLADLAAIRELDRDVRLGSGLGGVSPADLLALRETTRAANRAIAEKMTGGDLQFDPQYAVKDNPMDKAAVKFRQTRDIADYAARLEGIGEPSRDFIAELPGLSDFNLKGEHYLSGRMYSLQKAGGGTVGNAVERHILWPMKALDDAKNMWAHQQKSKISDWVDRYGVRRGSKRAHDVTMAMEDPNLQDVPIVKQLREILDSMRDETNVVRAAMGKDPIGYVENYVPHIEEISRLNKLFEAGKASHGVAPDFIRPGPGVNPRAMQRRGAVIKREMDIVRLLDNYINASARDMFNSPMIKHLNGHSAKMREYGLNGLANGLDYQTGILYSGKAPKIAEVLNAASMESPAFGTVRQGVLGLKSRLNKAIFTLNPVFTLFTQPLSGALTIKRAGEIKSAEAMRLGRNPNFRAWADQHVYSLRMKGNTYGSVRSQDVGGADATMTTDLMSRTKIGGKAAALSEYATAAMEREISLHAAAAHYILGRQRGLKGRPLLEFVSDGVAKTQSMYNFADLPGFLQERDLTAIALPFQTYAFELMNQVREMNIPSVRKVIGKTGQYANVSARSPEGQAILDSRMKQIVRWSAVIVAQQTLMNALDVEQDVFNPQSSIPFYSFIFDYGRGGRILPKEAVYSFVDGVKKYVQYGDWRPMRKFMLRYIVRGGIQANRMITGYEAVAAGGELDSRGVKKFKVKDDEMLKAMLFGPYGAEGGKAYIDKLEQQDKNQWKRKERTVTGSSDRGRGDGARGGRRDSGRGSNR